LHTARTEKIFKNDIQAAAPNFLQGRPSLGNLSGYNSSRAYN